MYDILIAAAAAATIAEFILHVWQIYKSKNVRDEIEKPKDQR